MILARLLGPKDFGLVGMVTAFTGVLTLFRDFGLSAAAVQHTTVTEEQISTLFWINILLALLGLVALALAMAPVICGKSPDRPLLGSRRNRDLWKGLPARQYSNRESEFDRRRGSVFGIIAPPGRSHSPQELLPERLLSGPRTDRAHYDCLRSFFG
jgi:hypothetical protein